MDSNTYALNVDEGASASTPPHSYEYISDNTHFHVRFISGDGPYVKLQDIMDIIFPDNASETNNMKVQREIKKDGVVHAYNQPSNGISKRRLKGKPPVVVDGHNLCIVLRNMLGGNDSTKNPVLEFVTSQEHMESLCEAMKITEEDRASLEQATRGTSKSKVEQDLRLQQEQERANALRLLRAHTGLTATRSMPHSSPVFQCLQQYVHNHVHPYGQPQGLYQLENVFRLPGEGHYIAIVRGHYCAIHEGEHDSDYKVFLRITPFGIFQECCDDQCKDKCFGLFQLKYYKVKLRSDSQKETEVLQALFDEETYSRYFYSSGIPSLNVGPSHGRPMWRLWTGDMMPPVSDTDAQGNLLTLGDLRKREAEMRALYETMESFTPMTMSLELMGQMDRDERDRILAGGLPSRFSQ